MNGHVYGLSEIVGTSTEGVDDAIRVGVQRASYVRAALTGSKSPRFAGTSRTVRSSTSRSHSRSGSGWRIRHRASRPARPGLGPHRLERA